MLSLTRLSMEESNARLTMRATSDGQYVDFEINVSMKYVPCGIDENNAASISIFPNPAHDIIRIETRSIESVKGVDIFNSTGQMVLSTDNTEINLSALPKGVYFISVLTENQKIVKRIVKE